MCVRMADASTWTWCSELIFDFVNQIFHISKTHSLRSLAIAGGLFIRKNFIYKEIPYYYYKNLTMEMGTIGHSKT